MKTVLILGGNFLQVTAIRRAKELGYKVICASTFEDCMGRELCDEFHLIDNTDDDQISQLVENYHVDGILSYASDVCALPAARVCEKYGLPTNPSKSVEILTQKNLFRNFMRENNFLMPEGKSFHISELKDAKTFFDSLTLPVMIKPVDSSGSKGVTRVSSPEQYEVAFEHAMHYSPSKTVIIEKFIQKVGYQIDGDGFIANGKIEFFGVMDQHNNIERNPHAPIGLSYPSVQEDKYRKKAYNLIQDIFKKLNMKFGAFNFEYIIGEDDNIYLLEIGPRNGGNLIPDTLKYTTGVDMPAASVASCCGDDYIEFLKPTTSRIASSYVVHSMSSGKFAGIDYHTLKDDVLYESIFIKKGDQVNSFRSGIDCLGGMVIRFDNVEQMNKKLSHIWDIIEIKTI